MRKDKNIALKLRREGASYRKIEQRMNIPRSTLCDWLKDESWSKKVKLQLNQAAKKRNIPRIIELNKIRGEHLEKIYQRAHKEAKNELQHFIWNPLFVAGLCLYWGEGEKISKHHVKISNTDPLMIKIFVQFLMKICGVGKNKIKAHLLLYPDLSPEICIPYWSKISGIEKGNFNKCVVINGKHVTRRLKYGVCVVEISSSYLKEKINTWLTLFPSQLINNIHHTRE